MRNGTTIMGLALEDGDDVILDPTEEENTQAALDVELTSNEAEEISDEIDDIHDAVDDAVEDASTLDSLAEVMEKAADEDEGITPAAAEVATIAVEAIARRVGIDLTKTPLMPALESFGSTNSRVSATRIAAESVSEGAKKVWEAIKTAIGRAWDKIKEWAGVVLDKLMQLFGNRRKVLWAKVDKLGEGEGKEFENGRLAKAFGKPGEKTITTSEIHAVLSDHRAVLKAMQEVAKIPTDMKELATALQGGKDVDAVVSHAREEIEKRMKSEVVDGLGSKHLIRNASLDGQGKVSTKDGTADAKIQSGSKKALQDILHIIGALEKDCGAMKKAMGSSESARKAALSAMDSAVKSDKVEQARVRAVSKELSSELMQVNRVLKGLVDLNVAASKAGLDYVDAACSAHGKPEKKEEEGDKK